MVTLTCDNAFSPGKWLDEPDEPMIRDWRALTAGKEFTTNVCYLSKMRRGFSILLILIFSLGPMAATLQADDESGLPACCRRHGAHHCSMGTDTAQAAGEPGAAFSAPARCPFFPRAIAPLLQAQTALTAHAGDLQFAVERAPRARVRAATLQRSARSHSVRGPPNSLLA
jgi:hypothetical protein